MFDDFVQLVRGIYQTDKFIQLHEPSFSGREKEYLLDAIDSTFVSSVGSYVDRFELDIAKYTGANYAIATVNGTSALHIALLLAGVEPETEVITQPLTFVATCNAIKYCGAEPIFVDVDRHTLGMHPDSLKIYLDKHAEIKKGVTWNKTTKKRITACLPMHTFGIPVDMISLMSICNEYNIPIVEDAAESLGSTLNDKHTGTFGICGTLSFNGNKIITTGGGGMILTNNKQLAERAKHLTTTAKVKHKWLFCHDEVGYNYRMPNLNAALGVAQLERLPSLIEKKRDLAKLYSQWCTKHGITMIKEQTGAKSNFWLNTIILKNRTQRDAFLEHSNNLGVATRPAWKLMHLLPMFAHCHCGKLDVCEWLSKRIINIPSSPLNKTV
jgi:perosamine synthetase